MALLSSGTSPLAFMPGPSSWRAGHETQYNNAFLLPAGQKVRRAFTGVQMFEQGAAENHAVGLGLGGQFRQLRRFAQSEAQSQRQGKDLARPLHGLRHPRGQAGAFARDAHDRHHICLLYTSDAADE